LKFHEKKIQLYCPELFEYFFLYLNPRISNGCRIKIMSKRHTHTLFFFSSSHCQWPSVWKYRNNVFHFALPLGFASSWVTRQPILFLFFFVFFILFSLFLIGLSQKVSCLSNKSWNEEWQYAHIMFTLTSGKKATERKKSNQLNIFVIIYSLISMRVCNVMWNDFKKKERNEVYVTEWTLFQ
jgi:hypothetical protein